MDEDVKPSREEALTIQILASLEAGIKNRPELSVAELLQLRRWVLDKSIRYFPNVGFLTRAEAPTMVLLGLYTKAALSINDTTSTASTMYSPLETQDIRLLTILSAEGEDVVCRLDTYPCWLAPDYDALSYCWGEDEETTSIVCNESKLEIRKNLCNTLQYLLKDRPRPIRPLWIDAICLNQSDDDEKAAQVPRMGELYKAATRTLVWLGENVEDNGLALDFLKCLADNIDEQDDIKLHNRTLKQKESKSQLTSLTRLLYQPWFFQSLGGARNIHVAMHINHVRP